ncbi:MAG: DUF5615 family PIN-like protein [Parafilimonas sp.]
MRFLCDVHISYKIKAFLQSQDHYCIHINEILSQDRTDDRDISAYCNEKNLILITKDEDFLDSYFIERTPNKLLKINLGNISTVKLIDIITKGSATYSKDRQ